MIRNTTQPTLQNIILATLLATLCSVTAATAASDDNITAKTAFDQLQNLAGSWHGVAKPGGEEDAEAENSWSINHTFQASAGGTVIMEKMNPGTDHEMINMYHLDGNDLLLTHYCSGGNQPRMRLNLEGSTEDNLVFDFISGTNLNVETDHHIHDAAMRWNKDGTLVSAWMGYSNGKPAGEMVFTLQRNK